MPRSRRGQAEKAAHTMSPSTKITREQWVKHASDLLRQGRIVADIPISELCELAGVTKGSLYRHFPGGMGELDAEVIQRWAADNSASQLRDALAGIRDPLDRLRRLWERLAATAVRDGAMRRWAS